MDLNEVHLVSLAKISKDRKEASHQVSVELKGKEGQPIILETSRHLAEKLIGTLKGLLDENEK